MCIRNNYPFSNIPNEQAGECGSTITKSFTLIKDIDCDCPGTDGFALKVSGRNVALDLNGHKVSCNDRDREQLSPVIVVEGFANTIKNGVGM